MMASAAEDRTGAPANGAPYLSDQARFPDGGDDFHSVVVVSRPASIAAEAVRALRTRIMAQHVQVGRRALAICGATPDSGCTFTAANLAVSLAQIGVRTALVDADLRNPSLSALLGVDPRPGLADYLSDPRMEVGDVIGEPIVPCLSYVAAGSHAHSPQELLATTRFAHFAGHLLRDNQITIFDTTAANGCTDAQRVATVAGYSLLVARKNSSYVADLATLAKLLRADGSNVVGSVLVDF